MTRSLRVLSTDDDEGIRALLFHLLEENGHQVEFARDGEEVFKLLGGHKYDLLILDVNMPGLNGYKVAEKLTGNVINRPKILIFTARDIKLEAFQFVSSGADAILHKGDPCDKIINTINGLFQEKSAAGKIPQAACAGGTQERAKTMPENPPAQTAKTTAELVHKMDADLKYCLSRLVQTEDLINLKNLRYEEFIRDLLREKQRTEKNYLEFKRIEGDVVQMKNWGYALATVSALALLRSLFR